VSDSASLIDRPQRVQPLRTASWNIQSCRRGLAGVAEQLRTLEADLVALQEVDRGTRRSGGIDQARTLAREAGYPHCHFFRAATWEPGEYGLALLARHPLSAPRVDPLPSPPGGEPRILASATLEHPLGRLDVSATHLSHRLTDAALRYEQARHITRLLVGPPTPRLLLGDFNGLAGSRMHRELTDWFCDVFAAVGEGDGGTRPLGPLLPAVRIDYQFASRDLLLERARVLATRASDHHVLVAEVLAPADLEPRPLAATG
jgi:endonuclease/exonuclease/phosphatase family metal-dependent hydrolase